MRHFRLPVLNLPATDAGRRRLVRIAQITIVVMVVIYIFASTYVLLSLSARNTDLLHLNAQLLERQDDATAAHQTDAANRSKELREELERHDAQMERLLKGLKVEVRAIPNEDGSRTVYITRTVVSPGPTVTAKPRCERLPNGRCRR